MRSVLRVLDAEKVALQTELDAIPCYLGYLWPLWDAENRTFTVMILNTRVYKKL